MAYDPSGASVVAFQSDPTKLQVTASVAGTVHVDNFSSVIATQIAGSVMAVSGSFTPPANQSVSGVIGASVIGLPTVQTGNNSVISTMQGSVATVIIGGSVAASFTPPANQSVSGTVGASMIGQVTVVSSIAGGIFPVSGSVSAVVTNNVTVLSSIAGGIFPISGSVAAVSTNIGSIIALNIGSIISLNIGSVITVEKSSSILAVPVGSVITLNQGSSILAVPVGSVITVHQGSVATAPIGLGGSSVYAVLSSITSVSIMAANSARRFGTIYNAAGTTVYVKLGTAANTSVYTVALNPNDYYELPQNYTSVVAGIVASTTGGIINVTELTI